MWSKLNLKPYVGVAGKTIKALAPRMENKPHKIHES